VMARADVLMLCLSPEQLISDGFAGLLEHKPFWNHFCALAVDEIHLLYSWGLSFRFVFQQIEFVRCHGMHYRECCDFCKCCRCCLGAR